MRPLAEVGRTSWATLCGLRVASSDLSEARGMDHCRFRNMSGETGDAARPEGVSAATSRMLASGRIKSPGRADAPGGGSAGGKRRR